ncbi:GCG_CRPN prefix-to-repeats domain-containing protein [Legionella sp.]|uniref:GCG_CRPN prefix-to-repeats domain-containing protein n=1 Tax=Legionella sp. TaxID=459 RepID=UPI003C804C14
MNTMTLCFAKSLRTMLIISILGFMASYIPVANAAQGCGYGFHRNMHGRCVLNHPGPRATPAPYHRGCWRNAWGQLRCYR